MPRLLAVIEKRRSVSLTSSTGGKPTLPTLLRDEIIEGRSGRAGDPGRIAAGPSRRCESDVAAYVCLVQPSKRGVENQEIATGVGVKWKGQYLILTAGHVVDYCPEDTLRFLLPMRDIQFAPRQPRSIVSVELRGLVELSEPRPPVFADHPVDLAAIILPPQPGADECFVVLDEQVTMPTAGVQVGVFGYPGAIKIPIGENYMATPEHFFGALIRPGRHVSTSRSRTSRFLTKCRTGPMVIAAVASAYSRPSPCGLRSRDSAACLQRSALSTRSFRDIASGRFLSSCRRTKACYGRSAIRPKNSLGRRVRVRHQARRAAASDDRRGTGLGNDRPSRRSLRKEYQRATTSANPKFSVRLVSKLAWVC